jgi:hypothetical protein
LLQQSRDTKLGLPATGINQIDRNATTGTADMFAANRKVG